MSREGHGGAGIDIPYHQAVFRSKVMALTHVPEDWKEVWESEEAAPYAARAEFLLEEPAGREYHGANQLDEPGVRVRLTAGWNGERPCDCRPLERDGRSFLHCRAGG